MNYKTIAYNILDDMFYLDLTTGKRYSNLKEIKEDYSNSKRNRAFARREIIQCFQTGTIIKDGGEKTKYKDSKYYNNSFFKGE